MAPCRLWRLAKAKSGALGRAVAANVPTEHVCMGSMTADGTACTWTTGASKAESVGEGHGQKMSDGGRAEEKSLRKTFFCFRQASGTPAAPGCSAAAARCAVSSLHPGRGRRPRLPCSALGLCAGLSCLVCRARSACLAGCLGRVWLGLLAAWCASISLAPDGSMVHLLMVPASRAREASEWLPPSCMPPRQPLPAEKPLRSRCILTVCLLCPGAAPQVPSCPRVLQVYAHRRDGC